MIYFTLVPLLLNKTAEFINIVQMRLGYICNIVSFSSEKRLF